MNRLVRSSSGFHWWAWRLCWNVWWWWWWVGGSSLREGLWNVLALLGAERSEHSNIMDIRSTQVNVPYNWVFLCTYSFFAFFFSSFEFDDYECNSKHFRATNFFAVAKKLLYFATKTPADNPV